MLILTRRVGQTLVVDEHIYITLCHFKNKEGLIAIRLNGSEIIIKSYLGEPLKINNLISLTLQAVKGNQIVVSINAPKKISILRQEAIKKHANN